MSQFKILLWQNQSLLGQFESAANAGHELIQQIRSRFPQEAGFRTEVMVASDEKRIIESSRQGIRLISREVIYQPYNKDATDQKV
ncbi:hypothetical protein [Thalassolituus pacificus]|uniref:Cytoplasmic protein n=1 Tax=Thalassolituus pacificus TaxID=2975440 RepID=A0A9X2WJQ1_9GAMM|nr:hypothetical protein [Thalassolituus pacificus]MCT7361137.1 hypothetical protein [Thalassolituus pacificus]